MNDLQSFSSGLELGMVFEETTEVYEHMDHMAMPKLPAEIAESNSLAVFNSKLLPHIAKNY